MSISPSSSTASLLSQTSLISSSPYTATKDPYTGKVTYTYNAPAPVSINGSTLLAAAGANSAANTGSTANAKPAPTAPWSTISSAPKQSALVTAVTDGAAFFDPSAAKLDAPAGANEQDYKGLFALYQGLNALQGLATQASASGVTATQQAAYAKTFAKGMEQLSTYLASDAFKAIDVAQGTIGKQAQTTQGAVVETDTYITKPLATGSTSTPVDAFQGPVAFTMQAKSLNGAVKTVSFDLSEMGSTPRTMANVVSYLNGKAAAAGVETRFADVRNPGLAQTVTVNGKSETVSTSEDTFSLKIVGRVTEKLTFSASASTPAVYLTSQSGAPGKTTTAVTTDKTGKTKLTTTTGASDVTQTLTKLDAGSNPVAADPGDGVVQNQTIANKPTAVRATATGADGSVYVLADVAGKTDDGQSIKGTSDVALMKYDSAGNLQYTRTVGAANAANGYALAVSADGSQVAVAGTTTGPLDTTDTGQKTTGTTGFLSVFSSAGEEQWTQTRVSSAGDTPTGVAFGSSGQVFVTGTATGALLGGGGQVGGQDSYIQGFTGKQVTAADGTKSWTSSISFTQQFGTSGTDRPSNVVVSGSSLYVAGTENGHAVVRQYALQSSGAPTLSATRDLGDLKGGEVAGIAVQSDGSLVVAGATHNGALSGGSVGQAYVSGKEGFVATLSSTLTPTKLNYVAAPSDFSAAAMTLSGGKVYLAGKIAQAPQSGHTTGSAAYVAEVDPSNGAVGWSRTLTGRDGIDAPTGIAVAQGGASALDALGLPNGTIDYSKSTTLVGSTSVRAGDEFQIKAGSGAAKTITIQPGDTFASLAAEINSATGFQASATTSTVNGKTVLKIVPLNARTPIQLISGAAGKDALGALGLTSGEITLDAKNALPSGATTDTGSNARSVLGLNLPTTLDISTASGAKAAVAALNLATAKLENLYQDLSKPKSKTAGNQTPLSNTLSNYYSSQLSNYKLALSRLGG